MENQKKILTATGQSENESYGAGRVTLVGAGPGDPGLITVLGQQMIRQADAIVYDALANPVLLDLAPAHAQRIDAGKRAKEHRLTQDQTNQLLVDLARQGKHVVRLKGGDPYLFGRGAEEAQFIASHGVMVTVVPGITSGIAAPMYAGIPVTHRDHASAVCFVTGHEDPAKADTALDYAALAALVSAGGTLCLYMGVGRIKAIRDTLMESGLPGDTPLAAIRWGTLPQQQRVVTTLANAVNDFKTHAMAAPAIIVVGPVAGIDAAGLDFFFNRDRKPLLGQTVVVTRTRQHASSLTDQLRSFGAAVLEAPTIELAPSPPSELAKVDAALHMLFDFDWLVLTSAHAVHALAQRLTEINDAADEAADDADPLDARSFAGLSIATVGGKTSAALWDELRIKPDYQAADSNGLALGRELTQKFAMDGTKVLLLRSDIARPDLPRVLADAGAAVTEHTLYQTLPAAALPDDVLAALRDGAVDWVTFTSSSTAQNMVQILGDEAALLEQTRRASIGPVTSQALSELGLPATVEAASASIEALVRAIVDHAPAR